MKKLRAYRDKRDPSATNEPFGEETPDRRPSAGTRSGAFVVHLHDATRRHYDLRLEIGAALASFAVPRGPSLNPDDKSLAVKTEDHPLEYLEFEDVVPEGQYGAGPMIVWDRGSVEYLEGTAEEGVSRGKLDLLLSGMKLHGRWALVKLKKSDKDEWLLLKKRDAHSNPDRDVRELFPRSVLSGLTNAELERRDEVATSLRHEALVAGGVAGADVQALRARRRSPLAEAKRGRPSGGSVYDAELGGVRVLAIKDGDAVALVAWSSSGGEAIEAFYPDVVRSLRTLPASSLAMDGELVTFDADGRPAPRRLEARARTIAGGGDVHRVTTTSPVVLVAKDLLLLADVDLRRAPLERRRALLARMLPPIGFLRASPPLEGARDHVVATCAALGIARVVAKPKRSTYESSASKSEWRTVETGAPEVVARVDHAGGARASVRKVTVSNRDKVFWPEDGLTKGDLCDYYAAVADTILPYVEGRSVILVRYPDGIAGKSFYQWNVPAGMPPWIKTTSFEEDGKNRRGFLVDDAATLLYLANLAMIPLHILASRAVDPVHAEFFTIDFDVKQSELRQAIVLAHALHELLGAIELVGFPKTSGQSGIHVLVPLGRGQSFETACALADLLGKLLVDRHPETATMERVVSRRGARVYVDTGQTGPTRAIVAPYSVRAVAGARVSTPLAWDELSEGFDPGRFTIRTVPARIRERGDPMRAMLEAEPDVGRAVARLGEIVR